MCRNSPPYPTAKLFTGQRLDATGLYYYGARYYDATIGRFISPDTVIQSLANPQTLNRYSYCGNNPLKYTDPTGHDYISEHGGGTIAPPLPKPPPAPPKTDEPDLPLTKSSDITVVQANVGAGIADVWDNIPPPVKVIVIAGAIAAAAPWALIGGIVVWGVICLGIPSDSSISNISDKVPDPGVPYPGENVTDPPGPGYEWGTDNPDSKPGDKDGNWTNPKTGESLRPDLGHGDPQGPHWDYRDPNKKWWWWNPDGTLTPKP